MDVEHEEEDDGQTGAVRSLLRFRFPSTLP